MALPIIGMGRQSFGGIDTAPAVAAMQLDKPRHSPAGGLVRLWRTLPNKWKNALADKIGLGEQEDNFEQPDTFDEWLMSADTNNYSNEEKAALGQLGLSQDEKNAIMSGEIDGADLINNRQFNKELDVASEEFTTPEIDDKGKVVAKSRHEGDFDDIWEEYSGYKKILPELD